MFLGKKGLKTKEIFNHKEYLFLRSSKSSGHPLLHPLMRKGIRERENGEISSFRFCHEAIVPITATVMSSQLNCQVCERRFIHWDFYNSLSSFKIRYQNTWFHVQGNAVSFPRDLFHILSWDINRVLHVYVTVRKLMGT